ncbi:hypothetical protein ACKWTF_010066 [Chironomus riparius]
MYEGSCTDVNAIKRTKRYQFEVKKNRLSSSKINELCSSSAYTHIYCDEKPQNSASISASSSFMKNDSSIEIENFGTSASTPCDSQLSNMSSGLMESSTLSSDSTISCPIPTSIIWWRTTHAEYNQNRAIIGYSDGCIVVVQLVNNCPFVGNTSVEKGAIEKFAICKGTSCDTIYLMINTSTKEQYKLLLEQKSICYTFPNDIKNPFENPKNGENDWEILGNETYEKISESTEQEQAAGTSDDLPNFFPAAKARLLSLRDLGAKKIGNLKMKLAERNKSREKERIDTDNSRSMHENVSILPELLTTTSGPIFTVQNHQNRSMMGAIHSYSSTLSIHNIEIMMIPTALYKIPQYTCDVLLTENIIFTLQPSTSNPIITSTTSAMEESTLTHSENNNQNSNNNNNSNSNARNVTNDNSVTNSSHDTNDNNNINNKNSIEENTISIISCNIASTKIGEENEFNERAILGSFKFSFDEKILGLLPMLTFDKENVKDGNEISSNEVEMKSTYSKYLSYHSKSKHNKKFDDIHDCKVLKNEFPRVIFDKCLLITSKGVYCVELKEKPHIIFLNLASSSLWTLCDDFCKTFNLNMTECVEFSGDILLRKKKIEQALLTYNIARTPPIKTALKLAMFNEASALRQIASMALKTSYILESKHPMSPLINELIKDIQDRQEKSEVVLNVMKRNDSDKVINAGKTISDFSYESSDNFEVQMSNSAQFHLSNLLFLTLCEKVVKDKNLMPLWNFIVTNNKYHTSLSSIILSQSGLYSSAVLLAMHRGSCLDVFSCLVSMADHVLDISNEITRYMYNLSDEIFMETIVYLQNFGFDYFEAIRKNLDKLDELVLVRLAKQLNPFDPVYRPVLFKVKNQNIIKEMENKFLEFCQALIETYIMILIKLQKLQHHKDNFLHSINVFRVTSEERQNYVKLMNFSPISAGFSHSGCIVDNSVYMWGTNGINCALNRNVLQSDASDNDLLPTRLDFFKDINLDVFSVHCGRSHTLFLTNNGLYAMGCNKLGQLGIEEKLKLNVALQPMLIKTLDNKNITQISVGQHHNAIVADDELYAWGWNVYAQCGHVEIKNIRQPKLVEFFSKKKIKQIACGQAHTLVLTYEKNDNLNTCLYAFGSNHFGQIGTGNSYESDFNLTKNNSISFVPQRIKIDEDIRLIHTRYFVNFAVTDSNKLLTWGLSPPELRIINQTKKRNKANQKLKESALETEKQETETAENSAREKTKLEPKVVNNSNAEKNEELSTKTVPEIKIDECEKVEQNNEEVSSINNNKKVKDAAPSGSEEQVEDPKLSTQEYVGHLQPTEVDTYDVDSDIISISSGIYHYGLITTSSTLYMWGKNIERQLARESVKPDITTPSKCQAFNDIEVKYVDCGADYTLVITNENELKTFGNNGNGQCGVENLGDKQGAGKLIRFKSSKRVFRIPESSMYLHNPASVKIPLNAPSTFVNFSSNQPICYLKNLPKFKKHCIIESALSKSLKKQAHHQLYVDEKILDSNRNPSFSSISSVASETSTLSSKSSYNGTECDDPTKSNDYIHYCLFLFQGLYDSTHFYEKSLNHIISSEYKIRTLMLNYNYIEAFKQALESDGRTSALSIKIFEYFTTDQNIIPMHTEDIKYFIYDVFLHFIKNQMDVSELEKYFLCNLDYYFLQLAFILYFCGNNNNNNNHNNNNVQPNGLEKQLYEKFKHLYSNYENFAYFDTNEIEMIFKSITTNFHCALCQNILKYSENFN